MPEPLRYILIGAGGYGANWCEFALPRLAAMGKATCVAAVDIIPGAFGAAQQRLGLEPQQCYSDPSEAFDRRKADFAVIVTPPATREKLVDLALLADLHVLCEAPMAESMATACRMYRKVRDAEKKLGISAGLRFEADKQTLRQVMTAPGMGRLNYLVCRMTANYRRDRSWGRYRHAADDPLLTEVGTQHFDVIRALTGSEIKSVVASAWTAPWGAFQGEATALALMETTGGARVSYEASVVNAAALNPQGGEYIRAECEGGTVELDRGRLRIFRGDGVQIPSVEEVPLLEYQVTGNAVVAEQFCDYLRRGLPKPHSHMREFMPCTAAVFAAAESAAQGKAVDVAAYLEQQKATADKAINEAEFLKLDIDLER